MVVRLDLPPPSDDEGPQRTAIIPESLLRRLGSIPNVEEHLLAASDWSQITVQASSTEGQPPHNWIIYSISVSALQNGTTHKGAGQKIALYHLSVEQDSNLGNELSKLLHSQLDNLQAKTRKCYPDSQQLLSQIHDLAKRHAGGCWHTFTDSRPSCITREELDIHARVPPNAILLQVLPTIEQFVTDPSSISTTYVSMATFADQQYVLLAALHPESGTASLELRYPTESGQALRTERFKMSLHEQDPRAWLQEIADRVYHRSTQPSSAQQRIEASKRHVQLLSKLLDVSIDLRSRGPKAIEQRFPKFFREAAANYGKPAQSGESDLDKTIGLGKDVAECNVLPQPAHAAFTDRGDLTIHLVVGDCLARLSVESGLIPGMESALVWYLKNRIPFKEDTSKLEELWRLSEVLRSQSEAAILDALERINTLCEPLNRISVRRASAQDLLNFDVTSVEDLRFGRIQPETLEQMLRLIQGQEDIMAEVINSPYLNSFSPDALHIINFSLHPDGALSIEAHNSRNKSLSAFMPATTFLSEPRDTIILSLSEMLVEDYRTDGRQLQDFVRNLTHNYDGWCLLPGNEHD